MLIYLYYIPAIYHLRYLRVPTNGVLNENYSVDIHDCDLDLLHLDHPHNRGFNDCRWACGSRRLRLATASQFWSLIYLLGRLARNSRGLFADDPRSSRLHVLRLAMGQIPQNPRQSRRSSPSAIHRSALTPLKKGLGTDDLTPWATQI